MHRYTFPESKESGFILDMDYNIQQQINQVMEVEAVNDTVLRGRKRSAYWAYRQDLYFYAVFSKPFTYTLYTDTVQENDKQIPVCLSLIHIFRENHKSFQGTPPLYLFLTESIPGKYAIGIGKDEAVYREVTTHSQ